MLQSRHRRCLWFAGASVFFGLMVIPAASLPPSAEATQTKEAQQPLADGPQRRAEAMGIKFEKLQPGYLNGCVRSGNLLFTSGFGSKMKGRLGKDLTAKEGYQAARECC